MKHRNGIYTIIIIIALFILVTPSIMSSQEGVISPEMVEQCQRLLDEFLSDVITQNNFQDFNFRTFQEVKEARLGNPMPLKFIGLREIKTYKAGTSVKSLIRDPKRLWKFSVMVAGEIRGQLIVREKNGDFKACEFGNAITAKTIALVNKQMKAALELKSIKPPYQSFLLEIPALMATFFYVESSEGIFFVPAMELPERYKLKNGKLYPAEEVLYRLNGYAKGIDENLFR